jgi:hypothetical protein
MGDTLVRIQNSKLGKGSASCPHGAFAIDDNGIAEVPEVIAAYLCTGPTAGWQRMPVVVSEAPPLEPVVERPPSEPAVEQPAPGAKSRRRS